MLLTSSLKLSDEGRGPAKANVLPSSLWGIINSSPHTSFSTAVISGSDTNSESSTITGFLSSTAKRITFLEEEEDAIVVLGILGVLEVDGDEQVAAEKRKLKNFKTKI